MSQAVQTQEQKKLEKLAQQELIQEVYAQEGLKKAPVKENRKLAVRVLAAAVALSILLVGPIKLSGRHNRVIKEFKNGSTSTQYTIESVYNYIQEAAGYADEMVSKMEAGTVSQEKLDALSSLTRQIKAEKDEGKLVALYNQLIPAADEAYNEYKLKAGGNESSVYRSLDAIKTTQIQINNLPYWQKAAKYNSARGGFPANLMGSVFGIDYVPDKSGH